MVRQDVFDRVTWLLRNFIRNLPWPDMSKRFRKPHGYQVE